MKISSFAFTTSTALFAATASFDCVTVVLAGEMTTSLWPRENDGTIKPIPIVPKLPGTCGDIGGYPCRTPASMEPDGGNGGGWVFCINAICEDTPTIDEQKYGGKPYSKCQCWQPSNTPNSILPDKKKGGGANCVLDSGPGGEEMCQQMNAGALISTYGPQGSARESPDPTYSFEAALCKPRTPWAWCWGAPCYKTPGTPTGITCDCPYMSTDSMVAQPLSLAGKGECAAHPPLYNPCDHIHNAQLPFADVQSEYCFVEAGVKPPCVETCSASDGPGPGPPPPSKSKSKKGRDRRSDSK